MKLIDLLQSADTELLKKQVAAIENSIDALDVEISHGAEDVDYIDRLTYDKDYLEKLVVFLNDLIKVLDD